MNLIMIDSIITEAGFILIGGIVALIPVYLLSLVLQGASTDD